MEAILEDGHKEPSKPKYEYYFHCKACNAILNHKSYNVKNGVKESPYCSKCSSLAFDTSDSEREYEHQETTDQFMISHYSYESNYD